MKEIRMTAQGEFFELPNISQDDIPGVSQEDMTDAKAAVQDPANSQSAQAPARRGMKDLSIPKLYYSISEVSRLTALEQYVLRYWETEFTELRPQKNRAGNRIYSNKDIKFILKIKELLREKRYTIEGAKQILSEEMARDRAEEKLAAKESHVAQTPSSDPGQIIMEEPKANSVAIHHETIKQMKATILSLRSMLQPK